MPVVMCQRMGDHAYPHLYIITDESSSRLSVIKKKIRKVEYTMPTYICAYIMVFFWGGGGGLAARYKPMTYNSKLSHARLEKAAVMGRTISYLF